LQYLFVIYVTAPSLKNLEVGLENSTWGLRDAPLDKNNYREIARTIREGSTGILAYHGPNSRVDPGGWGNATFRRVYVVRFTAPMARGIEPVWEDDVYPNRLPFELLGDITDAQGMTLTPDMREALRMSANTGGVPHRVVTNVLDFAGDAEYAAGVDGARPLDDAAAEDDQLDDRTLAIDGDLDGIARAVVRREQKRIRRLKLGERRVLPCDICGRQWPRRFLTAAHVKRRRDANNEERLDLNNIMIACPECDLLFEWGHIAVTPAGVVVETTPEPSDMPAVLEALAGRSCAAYSEASAPYFSWHVEERFRG
jgi:hypothetical protein